MIYLYIYLSYLSTYLCKGQIYSRVILSWCNWLALRDPNPRCLVRLVVFSPAWYFSGFGSERNRSFPEEKFRSTHGPHIFVCKKSLVSKCLKHERNHKLTNHHITSKEILHACCAAVPSIFVPFFARLIGALGDRFDFKVAMVDMESC